MLTGTCGTCNPLHVDTTTLRSGLDLKVLRTRHRVKGLQVAAAMGVSPSRVAAIEREAVVSPAIIARYAEAVRTCSTSGTSQPPAEVA